MKILTAGLASFFFCCVLGAEGPSLTLLKTVRLPGVKGRFDHFAIDTNGHRLFVAALGNNTVEIIDVNAGSHVKSIGGLHKPTGLFYIPEKRQLGIANGGDGTFKVFDAKSFDLRFTVKSLDDADNVRYDGKTKLIYVGYADGALALIDSGTMKQAGTIKLDAHPESFQLEKVGSRIFVNLPDSKKVAVVDRARGALERSWPMTDATANFPMALDETRHRLFLGCRQPPRLLALDTSTGKTIQITTICGDTDDLFYDGRRHRLYLSCGTGLIDIVEQIDADHYQLREQLPTRQGARTSFFSSELDQLYLAVPQQNGQEAEIRIYQPN